MLTPSCYIKRERITLKTEHEVGGKARAVEVTAQSQRNCCNF